nr:PREDICTED: electron transfer flavoprotein beta subunit lysine methyltransferase-like [Bemisia tabaci]
MPSVAKALRLPRVFQRSLSSKPSDLTDTTLTRTIRLHTELSVAHLTPELRLHLITPNCTLWRAPPSEAPFADPYWAFYWPGGQAIARYILDHPAAVRGRRVLDLGAGSGACGIAAAIAGAQRVLLNDIDPVACVAARLNLQENLEQCKTCDVGISSENLLKAEFFPWDLILIGDMFYDETFAAVLYPWLKSASAEGCSVLIGDPGRHGLSARIRSRLTKLEEYNLPEHCCLENRGFSSAVVWRLSL